MILWKEYQRIKDKGGNWTDEDVRILLNFCWEVQMAQHDIAEDYKKAILEIERLRARVGFYRNIYPIKEVS